VRNDTNHHQPSEDTMTNIGTMPDDQRQRIIEAATLMLKMQHLDQGEQLRISGGTVATGTGKYRRVDDGGEVARRQAVLDNERQPEQHPALHRPRAPDRRDDRGRRRRMVAEIVQQLTAGAQSGRMPVDALVFGWHGGVKPPNAVDTNDDAILSAWANRSMIIAVRVDPRPDDGSLRVDSDALAQMGLSKHDA
jgi:hypothetical protein